MGVGAPVVSCLLGWVEVVEKHALLPRYTQAVFSPEPRTGILLFSSFKNSPWVVVASSVWDQGPALSPHLRSQRQAAHRRRPTFVYRGGSRTDSRLKHGNPTHGRLHLTFGDHYFYRPYKHFTEGHPRPVSAPSTPTPLAPASPGSLASAKIPSGRRMQSRGFGHRSSRCRCLRARAGVWGGGARIPPHLRTPRGCGRAAAAASARHNPLEPHTLAGSSQRSNGSTGGKGDRRARVWVCARVLCGYAHARVRF